jgi:adenine-specific DNA glycosylase
MRLIQEEYWGDAWKVLASCVMLNRTKGGPAVPLIRVILQDYPTPASFLSAPRDQLLIRLTPLGLQRIKLSRLISLAQGLWEGEDVRFIKGIGRYGVDSYLMFVLGETTLVPQDKKLRKYAEEKRDEVRQLQSGEENILRH